MTGFDTTTKHRIVETLLRTPASLAWLLNGPGEVSVSVCGEGGHVFDSEHVTGALQAMLTALSERIMLRDDIAMLLEIDPAGKVREKVQDPAYHRGIASLLWRNPWIKTLLVDMATYGCADKFLREDSEVQAVGVSSMAEFKE